jgi:hypothetical protein
MMITDQYLLIGKVEIMITTDITKMENVWNTFQEPRCPAYLPNSFMLLLSALDQSWKVVRIELTPSWDQYGFIYLVTMKHPSHQNTQQLILPQNSLIADLLRDYVTSVASINTGPYQPEKPGMI